MSERFTLPNMAPSPWHKTRRTVIPELPADDSTYWRVKGGAAAELVWSSLEEQASRSLKAHAFYNSLKLAPGKSPSGALVPSTVVFHIGHFKGILSSVTPQPQGWMACPIPEQLKGEAEGVLTYWMPDPKTQEGQAVLRTIEDCRPLGAERLHYALFGDHGANVTPTNHQGLHRGLQIVYASVFCFVHAAAKPVAYLRVHRNQKWDGMTPEVRAGLEEIPGSRFWRLVETERQENKALLVEVRKSAKRKTKRR